MRAKNKRGVINDPTWGEYVVKYIGVIRVKLYIAVSTQLFVDLVLNET